MPPIITPMPPLANCVMPWDGRVSDTVATISGARSECGDTFVVDSGEDRYMFLFSASGLSAFYAVPEKQASKGIADWKMLRRKLPDELFDGRRTLPHELFGRVAVAGYLDALEEAISLQLSELSPGDEIDLFEFSRLLGHRLGLASWAGREILYSPRFRELVAALDALDGAEAFVRPARMATVAVSDKAAEREAMAQAEEILIETFSARTEPGDDLLGTIIQRWGDTTVAENALGAARDVILVHIGSMSNMFAALGWSLVHLVQHPDVLARVRSASGQGADTDLASRCVLESTRIAQRSIMLRTVLEPVVIDDGSTVYNVSPGATLATFLPLTNLVGAPGLDLYDPDRWRGRQFVSPKGLPDEAITTFGHGPHACPARPFSTTAMVRVIERLFRAFDLEPRFTEARPLPGQIGGVARAGDPCNVATTPRSAA
ncbi:MAG: cytochrome P450 [Acidimicrobiaceae bacterium]|nr:cytochrome P450 [Acidimicrobiaceae bacterium]MXW75684.1 cytochrome P450 [Acidimicrobiaceae bacterium]MYA75815.1 cytochrome P450 [Acidimicrobiaceae bacterium]MYC42262.1 cytochrome P450 [Acidimicrobiaceae bacterium]MYD07936.1 cytochrome P450 [Acidimicrobiaceae bacterium]